MKPWSYSFFIQIFGKKGTVGKDRRMHLAMQRPEIFQLFLVGSFLIDAMNGHYLYWHGIDFYSDPAQYPLNKLRRDVKYRRKDHVSFLFGDRSESPVWG